MLFRPWALCIAVVFLQTIVRADNYNVINTNDSGVGSLRQAILDANAHPNIDVSTPDTVSFAISGGGVRTITPLTELPAITDPVVIDGYTQPGASPNSVAIGDNAIILIELNGNSASFNGLTVTGGNSTVRGLVIDNFSGTGQNGTGIWLLNNGGNKIEGCFIGTNPTGTAELNNQAGVLIAESLNNTIGGTAPAARNMILGNASSAINTQFSAASTGTGLIVQGNYIGTDVTGTKALGKSGIRLVASSNLIGGTDAGAGNIISTGPGAGIVLELGANGNTIQGNFIGVTADGSAALGSGSTAIYLQRGNNNNLIGGDTAAARNVMASISISGDGSAAGIGQHNVIQGNYIGINAAGTALVPPSGRQSIGITISSGLSNTIIGNVIAGFSIGVSLYSTDTLGTIGHRLQGNFIGTNATGTEALPNRIGVSITSGGSRPLDPVTSSNLIGGSVSGNGNVISGNLEFGVSIAGGSSNTVQGNLIGLARDGSSPLPNGKGGIFISAVGIYGAGNGNQVGGKGSGAGNVIAYNGISNISQATGIQILSATGNAVLGNSIYANYGLGIDLGNYGPTPNDSGDADSGANNLQNFPIIASVSNGGGTATIAGNLNSIANKTYRVEFFANSSQGQSFLGSTDVTTDANGNAAFNFIAPQIGANQYVTATATDSNGNTSEFSTAIGQPLNIATRLRVQTDDNVLIGGFIVAGTDPKKVIVRGIGPSLANTGVPGFLTDPTLELHDASGATLETNDNWKTKSDGSSQQAQIEATTIPPANDLEAAIVRTLPANNARYTAILRGKNNTAGIGVVEAYDLDQAANSTLANLSTRGLVETGDDVLVGGFIAGRGLTKVIIRAIGPTLANSGVTNPLQDPTLELHDSSGATIASNDDWKTKSDGSSQQAQIEATGIPPTNDFESALVASLPPGNYTAIVRGKSDSTGVAVVEVYNIP